MPKSREQMRREDAARASWANRGQAETARRNSLDRVRLVHPGWPREVVCLRC